MRSAGSARGLLPEKLSDQMKAGRRADALKSSVREHSSAAGKSGGGSLAGASSDGARFSGERGSDAVVGRSEAGAAQLLGETCSSLAA